MRIIIEFFLNQKPLNHLLFTGLLLLSFFSYQEVAKEMFPPTTLDNVVISGGYRSSSAELLEQLIVRDCEEILKENPNLANISSVTSKGAFHITAELISGSKNLIVIEIAKSLKDKIGALPNIYKSELVGEFDKSLHVVLDYGKIEVYGLSKSKIIKAIGGALFDNAYWGD